MLRIVLVLITFTSCNPAMASVVCGPYEAVLKAAVDNGATLRVKYITLNNVIAQIWVKDKDVLIITTSKLRTCVARLGVTKEKPS